MHLTQGCGGKGEAPCGALWGVPPGWHLFDVAGAVSSVLLIYMEHILYRI